MKKKKLRKIIKALKAEIIQLEKSYRILVAKSCNNSLSGKADIEELNRLRTWEEIQTNIIKGLQKQVSGMTSEIRNLIEENQRLVLTEEVNKKEVSEELERGFNDLLHTGMSVSGPFHVSVDKNMLSADEIEAIQGISAPLKECAPTITTGGSLPKDSSENRFVTDIKSEHPVDLYLKAERLTPESHAKLMQDQHERQKNMIDKSMEQKECYPSCGMNYCDENGCIDRKARALVDPIEPKEQSSTEIWKEWADKSKKGVFDHPKYRSPFFKINVNRNDVEGNPV